jgi:Zn-dependent peptidase ImmA (M78 family)
MGNLAVSTQILEWAAERLGTSLDGLAAALASPKRVAQFKEGQLTLTQASSLASQLHIPFGYLFLKTPPADTRPELPDLRQTPNPEPLSNAFYEALQDIKNKVAWYSARLREGDAEKLTFVGKFINARVSAKAVANDIAKTISYEPNERLQCRDPESLYNLLANKFEAARVLVFRSSIARSNTKKPLPVSEFRGFAVVHSLAPAIFINGRDVPAAWIFTLIHEAAHIWLGQSGVSDNSASNATQMNGIEAFCNKVAAEFLTPQEQFLTLWSATSAAKIAVLSKHFKVSRLVIARRALDLDLIDWGDYQEVYFASIPQQKDDGGGNPYATIPIRSSRRFTQAVMSSAMSGETMLREAGRLLNVKPGTVVELYKRSKGNISFKEDQIV